MQNSAWNSLGLLIFRIGVSFWMIGYHGWGKLMHLFDSGAIKFSDPIGLGVVASFILALFAEFFCSILIALGVWTRLAAIPLAITMIVAFFIHHAPDAFADRETPGLFLVCYILLIFVGGGRYSLVRLGKKRYA